MVGAVAEVLDEAEGEGGGSGGRAVGEEEVAAWRFRGEGEGLAAEVGEGCRGVDFKRGEGGRPLGFASPQWGCGHGERLGGEAVAAFDFG